MKKITSETEYEKAVEIIEQLWDSEDDTPEAKTRDDLILLVEEYEGSQEMFA